MLDLNCVLRKLTLYKQKLRHSLDTLFLQNITIKQLLNLLTALCVTSLFSATDYVEWDK